MLPPGRPIDMEQEVILLHYEKRQTLPREETTTDPGSASGPNTHISLV